MIKVSIIIVHYKEKKVLYDCLNSIKKSAPKISYEIIVVDNDEIKTIEGYLRKHYPKVKYIKSPGDLGYGKGNNLGIKSARGEYVFILNPDTITTSGMVERMLEFIEKNKNVGAVAPSLYDEHGRVYASQGTGLLTPIRGMVGLSFLNKIFPNNPVSKTYWLKDINRNGPYEVDVVPGTAFMIKKSLFDRLGGFDKNFFLYFEESDLCKRIKEAGYKLYILPKAKLTHFWAVSTPPSDFIRKVFRESRFYYFKKNFGILNALLVEFFARLSLASFLLFLIIALGTFLRFYKLQENMIFNGEMGYDYTTIRTFVENHQIPLIGPRTSHEWFFIGPLFYWIFGILLPLFNYNVLVGSYFFAIVGVVSIPVCYFTLKSLFGKKVGVISSFLISISPLWIFLTRDARFNGVTSLLFFPFYYFLVKSTEDNGKSLLVLGIILGIMFSFFPSPILLVPGSLVVIYIYRKQIFKKYLFFKYFFFGILGFLIPNIPYLIYNATHKFEIIKNLFIWIPYRILGFVGLYPKNTVSTNVIKDNVVGLYTFFQASYFNSNNMLIFILVVSVILFAVWSFWNLKKNKPLQILLILSGISYLGLFLHGSPPQHYYLVIFPVSIILLSLFIEKISKKWIWLSIIILGYLLFFNFKFYFSKNWFCIDSTKMSQDMSYVPYSLQIKVVNFIANDSSNKDFSLSRVGPLDYFEDNFSLNYQYLLWNLNHKPMQDAKLKYTIYEDTSNLPKKQKIYWIENIAITKNEKI